MSNVFLTNSIYKAIIKKLICFITLLLVSLLLFSCSSSDSEDEKKEETTREPDWRDSIEYDGSFYVNESNKILYSLDIGKITLWNCNDKGKNSQLLEYDTINSDAFDNVEFQDFNGDGYTDIRLEVGTVQNNKYYNLWLWNDFTSSFSYCKSYREIPNPEMKDDNTVFSIYDRGIFGKVDKTYKFDDKLNCVLLSNKIEDPDTIANNISKQFYSDEIRLSENRITIAKEQCSLYIIGNDIAYLACSEVSDWYIDTNCSGAYRTISGEDSYEISVYAGQAYYAESAIIAKDGKTQNIVETSSGHICDTTCDYYTFEDGTIIAVTNMEKCLISEDGTNFYSINYTTGIVKEEEPFTKQ